MHATVSLTAAAPDTLLRANARHRPSDLVAAASFDEDGFLCDGATWNHELAEALAHEAGIDTLSPAHWQLIGVVRDRYHRLGSLPVMRRVCRAAGIEPGKAQRLFSGCRSLWRIAGLPNPGPEAIAYMH